MNAVTDGQFDPKFVVLERGWLSSNSLVVLGEGMWADQAAVIDTGYVTHAPQTLALVEAAVGGRQLGQIINTHLHSDHCGGNATLKRRWPAAQTHIPPGLAQAVQRWDEVELTYEPTGQQCEPFGFDALLQPGCSLDVVGTSWQVHAAPGHDTHSVVLFHSESRTLMSADALWGNGFGVVFPALDGADAFAEVGQTLDLIEGLQPLRVVPGHGAPFADVADALARARSRLALWQAHPAKHAEHGLKVLLKYKMLEMLRWPLVDLQHWMLNTAYFRRVHAAYAGPLAADGSNGFEAWANKALQSLLKSGALRLEGDVVLDGV